jgi:lipopolysaccharide export LptBFGC system permease protein LptF
VCARLSWLPSEGLVERSAGSSMKYLMSSICQWSTTFVASQILADEVIPKGRKQQTEYVRYIVATQ